MDARSIIPNIQKLLSSFRDASFPVFFTREGHPPSLSTLSSREQFRSRNNPSGIGIGDSTSLGRALVRGEPGHQIISELTPLNSEEVIDKPGRSAFAHTDFELRLRLPGIRNLILSGVTTDVCVHSTMRDANDRGFDCMLVEDASAAATPQLHKFAIESVKSEGGIFGCVGSVEDVVKVLSSGEHQKAT